MTFQEFYKSELYKLNLQSEPEEELLLWEVSADDFESYFAPPSGWSFEGQAQNNRKMKEKMLPALRSSELARSEVGQQIFRASQRGSSSPGFMLLDIILAMSLAVLFIAILSEVKISSEKIFYFARDKNELLDIYDLEKDKWAGLTDYESVNLASSSSAQRLPYGNERSETSIIIASSSLAYAAVAADSDYDFSEAIGKTNCSVDYYDHSVLGSYLYFKNRNGNHLPDSAVPNVRQILLPIDPLLPLTDLKVRNGIAYLTADSNKSSDPDFLIADIKSTPSTSSGQAPPPTILASLNTGPGLVALTIAFNRVYAAAPSTVGQLHIIRLNSLESVVLENRYKLPLPYATATPPLASSVFYENNKVYLGTEKWAGDEFNIIDVSDPANPRKTDGLELDTKVEDIYVRGGRIYLATPNEDQLRLLDGDFLPPSTISTFKPPGWSRQSGRIINFFENAVQFGRDSGGYNINTDPEAYAFATTSSSTLVQNISADLPGGVYGLLADRYRAYLVSRELNKEFQIFDHFLTASTSVFISLPIVPQRLTCDRDRLYVLAKGAPVIYEINF
ncbi:MAG: hypothetical protein WCT02_01985 [Candidatus Paceibacterota bacterium]|jgi:hypothetical protein